MLEYDLVIIGAGPGGYETALEASKNMRVALVEKDELGGTCLNRGCIPTKSLVHSKDVLHMIRKSRQLGIECGTIDYNYDEICAEKDRIVHRLRDGIRLMLKQNKVAILNGVGTIADEHTVYVHGKEDTVLKTEKIIISTGSRPIIPPIKGITCKHVETSDTLLEKKDGIYPRLIIIGGGVIGVEFASIFAGLGSSVTIIEAKLRIVDNMDREISQSLKMQLKKLGIEVYCDTQVQELREEGNEIHCTCVRGDDVSVLVSDGVLVCVGRKPYTEHLFGEDFTVNQDHGRIIVNEHYQTSCSNIYAIGDVIGGTMLAHVASAQGRCVLAHMENRLIPVSMTIPACIYTDPEIATVGMTIEQAKENGIQAESHKYSMLANARNVILDAERGFIKVVYEKSTHRLLGAQMMCPRASDLINEITQAVVFGNTLDELSSVIRPHPSFSEGITEAVKIFL